MDYNEISRDFAQRTKHLIESYKGEYEVTLLVNCCLGLLVVPKEKHFNKIPDEEIPIKTGIWGLNRESITVKCDQCGYSLRHVIRRIRNGICHFNIKSIPDEHKNITSLEICDGKDFSVTLSIAQLQELALSLTDHVYKP